MLENIFIEEKGTCNDTWKSMRGRNRYFVIADRLIAYPGGLIFSLLMNISYILVPTYILVWYIYRDTFFWSNSAIAICAISVLCSQSIMAYLREAYFYDSAPTYVFIGGMLCLFLIAVCSSSMIYIHKSYGIKSQHIACFTIFQLLELLMACIHA